MFNKRISDYIDSKREEMICDIASLVAIESTKSEPTEDCPYGKKTAEALEKMLELCRKYGFITKNISNAIGIADFKASDEIELGILSHLDVVPAGDGWETDPFCLEEKDGLIFGRGTSDDKGPAIAALYAMRAVKELGLPVTKNFRLIVGTDEECGSSDLKYYFDNEPMPHYSVSPDAEYPVINTEKGRFAPNFAMTVEDETKFEKKIISFEAGKAVNAVPNKAKAVICGVEKDVIAKKAEETEKTTGAIFELTEGNDGRIEILCTGKAAHASTPHTGINALSALVMLCNMLPLDDTKSKRAFEVIGEMFPFGDFEGKALGVAREDGISGKLTLTLDVLNFDGKEISFYFDSRMPVSATKENTVDPIIRKLFDKGFELRKLDLTPVHHVDENSPLIKTLLSEFAAYTGRKGECIAIGGGTYVHEIENGVAFGCIMPELDTHMHGVNEFMPIADLAMSAKIYASVIAKLCK